MWLFQQEKLLHNGTTLVNNNLPQLNKKEAQFSYGYIVVIAAFFIMVVSWATYNSFGIFFNPMLDEFGWSRGITSGAFSLSMFIYGILGIVVGALNDRLGPRVVLTLCGIFLGVGYLLMSQISVLWQLYLFFGVIIGIGMSGVWVPLLSTVAKWFVKRRTLMSGIVLAGSSIGGLIGPPIISRLIAAYDWRWSYIVIGIASMLLMVAATQFLRRDPTHIRQLPKFENKGNNQTAKQDTNSFTFKEAVTTIQFWIASGLFFCFGFVAFAIIVHIVPHAIDLKISPIIAANILAARGAVSILGNYMLGALADRIGNRQIYIIGFVMHLAALLWLSIAQEIWMLYLFIVIFGFATGGMGASESPITAWLFGLSSHGLIYGVVHVGFTLGAAAGPFVTGYIFDLTGGYQLSFLVCAAFSVIGLILTIILRPTKKLEVGSLEAR
jgi:MFS family permease